MFIPKQIHDSGSLDVGLALLPVLATREVAQGIANAQAAYPDQYKQATAGFIGTVATAVDTMMTIETGSISPDTVRTNEYYGCFTGNPAACPDAGSGFGPSGF